MQNSVRLLFISGPVGVGKTSVGFAVSDLLLERNLSHTFIDLDQLRYTYPRPTGDRFGSQLGLQNLRDVWRNFGTYGGRWSWRKFWQEQRHPWILRYGQTG